MNKTCNFKRGFFNLGSKLAQSFIRNNMALFFSPEFSTKKLPKKLGRYGFFQLIKKYAETSLLIDEKYISQEASYKGQPNSMSVKSPKI